MHLLVRVPLYWSSYKWENWFLQCEETAGYKFKGHSNFSSWLVANDILCNHRLILILCRSSAQLSASFSACTIANGELLYPPRIASSVCLEKNKVLLRHTYIYHTLPAFIGSQTNTQMSCKYLAVALTRTKILYKSAPHCFLESIMGCFLSLLCSQYLSGFYCLPSVTVSSMTSLHSSTPLSSLTII